MAEHRIFTTSFASVYPLYLQKVERKGQTQEDVDTIIRWLTGYDEQALEQQLQKEVDFRTFFMEAPKMNPKADLVTGKICGVVVENIQDPLMKQIRTLDKLIDELAKGKPIIDILSKDK